MTGRGTKELLQDLLNLWKVKRGGSPALIIHKLSQIIQVIEDVYSVANPTELQEAIDTIGSGAGTIFLESGTHVINTAIDIDGGGSYVIYGHGDNTILEPVDGVSVFNITDSDSVVIKTLKIDVSNYTLLNPNTPVIIVNEANNNVIGFYDVTIIGDGSNGIGIELQSNNSIIEHCTITQLKTGVYINNSENHVITGNTVSTNANYGIHLDNADYCILSGNTTQSNTIHGIYLDTCNYNTLSSNISLSNTDTGIYIKDSSNNTISSNGVNLNSLNGIYLTGSSYNTLSANTCENNDSVSIFNTAGIHITANSDFNTLSANSSNNNNNTGIGIGHGIYIAAATCNENIIASNNANGNDIDFMDAGTATTIEYYVQDSFELQDAIDSIGDKAGVVNIDASFAVATTIDIDGGGSYIIQGEGSNSTLTLGENITCFNITDARQVILKNFKIDATAYTAFGVTQEIIDVSEAADNLVIIDNVTITGDGFNGYGIEANSNNVQIKNCNIDLVDIGIYLNGDNCLASENIIDSCPEYGMDITGDYCLVSHNNINGCQQGMQLNGANYCNIDSNVITASVSIAGMYVFNLTGGNISNNTVTTTVDGSGIVLDQANYCTLIGNVCDDNNDSVALDNAGIHICSNSNDNHITGNTCINNNNTAVGGFGYGIHISAADCDNNIIRGNSCSGNDVAWRDVGTDSDFEYRCSTAAEIQDAIDSIAGKAGTITINSGIITISVDIDIDGGGSYIIEGQGDNTILTPDVLVSVFHLTDALSCVIKNLKINAENLTGTTAAISVVEVADNKVIIDNVTVEGDGDQLGYGIEIDSSNCIVQNCRITSMGDGIVITDENCIIIGNICNSNGSYGIFLNTANYMTISSNITNLNQIGIYLTSADGNIISGNTIKSNTADGIFVNSSDQNTIEGNICDGNITDNLATDHAGITIHLNSLNNIIIGNTVINNANGGAGEGYGIYVSGITCIENIVHSNNVSGNDIQWMDIGVNSDFEYRCSTAAEIQDAIDSIGAKSGIILIASGTITLTAAIDVDGGGSYIIKGQGANTIIDVDGDWRAFDISSVISCRIEDLKITAGDITTANREVIYIHNATGRTTIDNITIDCESGVACPISIDGTEYTTVRNSIFENILGVTAGAGLNGSNHYGLYINNNAIYTLIERNHFTAMKAGDGGDGGYAANGGNGGAMYAIYSYNSDKSIIESNYFETNIYGGDGGNGGSGDPAGNGGDGGDLYLIYVYPNDNLIKGNRVDRIGGLYIGGTGGNGGETDGGGLGQDGTGGNGGNFYGIYVFSDVAPQTNEVLLNGIAGVSGNGGNGGITGKMGVGGNGGDAYGIVDQCGAVAINSNYIGNVVGGTGSVIGSGGAGVDGNAHGIWLNTSSHTTVIGNQIQLGCGAGGTLYSIHGTGAEDLNIIVGNFCLTGAATITVAGANDIILGNIVTGAGEAGWSGWFDDGANFRVTVLNGIITAVANTTAGGHNP